MVLFKDEEKKIKEAERQEKLAKRTKFGIWVHRIIKISLGLVLVAVLGLGLLSALSGDNEALRNGIEDYISQSTGLRAEIGDFNHMAFFPNLTLDAGDIKLRETEDGQPVVTISKVDFSARFFDLMLSRKRLKALNIKELRVVPGVWGEKELLLNKVALEKDTAQGKPGLVLKGQRGAQDITAFIEMELDHKDQEKALFHLPYKSDFQAHIGPLTAKGYATKAGILGGLLLHFERLGTEEHFLSGEATVKKWISKQDIKADIVFGQSKASIDAKISKREREGDLDFDVLYVKDIAILQNIFQAFTGALPIQQRTDQPIDLYGRNDDFSIAIKELRAGESAVGSLNFPLQVKKQQLKAGPLSGTIGTGKLSGMLSLDATKLPATLQTDGDIKDWDYAAFFEALQQKPLVKGATANIKWAVTGEGESYDDIWKSLHGEVVMIGGEGEFPSAALNIWGAGLINAMLPKLDPGSLTKMNCLIADFKIENGIAKPSPLFMDTARLTVVGEGEINMPDRTINLKLEPKAKNPALLDVATALRVKGPIFNPSISTDKLSLFGKLGGLALGIVNPTFLVFSLTDVGLTKSHPCHKFIGGNKGDDAKESVQEMPGAVDARQGSGAEEADVSP